MFRVDPGEIESGFPGQFADHRIGQLDDQSLTDFSHGDFRLEIFQMIQIHIHSPGFLFKRADTGLTLNDIFMLLPVPKKLMTICNQTFRCYIAHNI